MFFLSFLGAECIQSWNRGDPRSFWNAHPSWIKFRKFWTLKPNHPTVKTVFTVFTFFSLWLYVAGVYIDITNKRRFNVKMTKETGIYEGLLTLFIFVLLALLSSKLKKLTQKKTTQVVQIKLKWIRPRNRCLPENERTWKAQSYSTRVEGTTLSTLLRFYSIISDISKSNIKLIIRRRSPSRPNKYFTYFLNLGTILFSHRKQSYDCSKSKKVAN